MKIDLNSDMGEGFGVYKVCDDEQLMSVVSSANVACGFHAGDPEMMARMVRLAKKNGVGVGAHPGLSDRLGFGRREIPVSDEEMEQQVLYQLGALSAIAKAQDVDLSHISFHAAMGNMINRNAALAERIMKKIKTVNSDLIVFSMPGMVIEDVAISCGMKVLNLFLADRAYDAKGQLVPRSVPNSVIKEETKVRARVRQLLQQGTVTTIEGETLSVPAQSILVHSDTPGSLELARTVRSEIEACGGTVAPAREVLG